MEPIILKQNVFLKEPPKDLSFSEMFRFIWLQGIGNAFDEYGEPKPWSETSLEDRFYEFGYEIDKRTIQNWLAGKNKPNAKNLGRLARVVSNDDPGLKRLWRDAFTMAYVFKGKHTPDQKALIPDQKVPGSAFENYILETTNSQLDRRLVLICLGMSAIILFSLVFTFTRPKNIAVTDFKICDDTRFDRAMKTCSTNVTHFPPDTKLIYVSFKMPEAPEGQAFSRKWYRNGQLFLSKDGFVDSAWEDYTWLKNPNGHDQGKYDLRIIVNGRVTTRSFFVGQVNEDHGWP